MSRILIIVIQMYALAFPLSAHGFDLFGSAAVSADRMEFFSELIGNSIAKFKCPSGTQEKSGTEQTKPGFDIYWKKKICVGVVNSKNIELQVQAVGGDLIGLASATIDSNKAVTCDSYIDSKIPFESDFFKNAKVNLKTEAYVGITDKHSKSIRQRVVFSCENKKIVWSLLALPLDLEFGQFGVATTRPLLIYPLVVLSNYSDASKSSNLALNITTTLGLYTKDLDAGFSKAMVEKYRKLILTNPNPSAMLQIFNDAVDATLDMKRARQFLKAQGLK